VTPVASKTPTQHPKPTLIVAKTPQQNVAAAPQTPVLQTPTPSLIPIASSAKRPVLQRPGLLLSSSLVKPTPSETAASVPAPTPAPTPTVPMPKPSLASVVQKETKPEPAPEKPQIGITKPAVLLSSSIVKQPLATATVTPLAAPVATATPTAATSSTTSASASLLKLRASLATKPTLQPETQAQKPTSVVAEAPKPALHAQQVTSRSRAAPQRQVEPDTLIILMDSISEEEKSKVKPFLWNAIDLPELNMCIDKVNEFVTAQCLENFLKCDFVTEQEFFHYSQLDGTTGMTGRRPCLGCVL
jgi:hypothetical protein